MTGMPFSDKTKLVAGLLQILLPFGIGRFYMGQTGLGVAQLLVAIFTCGVGTLWSLIDGIIILTGNPRDSLGRPMKMS
ncbi:TM2 domain-containing protein [Nocardioides humilatus]|uniref:TM2 domain-containing protein n=2 Tax=Nocardioides humilatus TaxID=2607660 RepID=A0A5B1LB01_9ACTN|nr:TM2 domain-containing protein [Nocardioides humilatus]